MVLFVFFGHQEPSRADARGGRGRIVGGSPRGVSVARSGTIVDPSRGCWATNGTRKLSLLLLFTGTIKTWHSIVFGRFMSLTTHSEIEINEHKRWAVLLKMWFYDGIANGKNYVFKICLVVSVLWLWLCQKLQLYLACLLFFIVNAIAVIEQ